MFKKSDFKLVLSVLIFFVLLFITGCSVQTEAGKPISGANSVTITTESSKPETSKNEKSTPKTIEQKTQIPTQTLSPTPTLTPTNSFPVNAGTPVPTPVGSFDESNPVELARWGLGKIYQTILSPKRDLLVVASSTGGYIYNSSDLQFKGKVGRDGQSAEYIQISPDGKFLAIATSGHSLDVFEFEKKEFLFTISFSDYGPSHGRVSNSFFTFSPDSKYLVAGAPDYSSDKGVSLYSLIDGKKVSSYPITSDGYSTQLFYSDNQTLFIFDSSSLTVYNTEQKTVISSMKFESLNHFAISRDRSLLILEFSDHTSLIDTRMGNEIGRISIEKFPISRTTYSKPFIRAIEISPDNSIAAILASDFQICLWDIKNKSAISCLPSKKDTTYSFLKFNQDGSKLFTGSNDMLETWNTTNWNLSDQKTLNGEVQDILFPVNEDTYITSQYTSYGRGREPVVNLWSFKSTPRLEIDARNQVRYIRYSVDGKMLISSGSENTVLWDPSNGSILHDFKSPSHYAEFSIKNDLLAIAMDDGSVQVFQLPQIKLVSKLEGFSNQINSISFNYEATRMVIASKEDVSVWNLADNRKISTLPMTAPALLVTYNGKSAITIDSNLKISIWDDEKAIETQKFSNLKKLIKEPQRTEIGIDNLVVLGNDSLKFIAISAQPFVEWETPILPNQNPFLRISRDGKQLAVNTKDGIEIIETKTQKSVANIDEQADSFDFSPENGELALSKGQKIEIFTSQTKAAASVFGSGMNENQPFFTLIDPKNPILPERLQDSTSPIIVSGANNAFNTHRSDDGTKTALLMMKQQTIMASSPDLKMFGFVAMDGSNLSISAEDLTKEDSESSNSVKLASAGNQYHTCTSLSLSNNGKLAAAIYGNDSGLVGIWSTGNGNLISRINEKSDVVAISSDGTLLATKYQDKEFNNHIKIYSLESPQKPKLIIDLSDKNPGEYNFEVTSFAFSPDGKWLAAGDRFGKIGFYDTENWYSQFSLDGHVDSITGLAFSSDGQMLFSTSQDGTIRVWGTSLMSTPFTKPTVQPKIEISPTQTEGNPAQNKENETNSEKSTDSITEKNTKTEWVFGTFNSDERSCSNCVFGLWPMSEPKGKVLLSVYGNNQEIRSFNPFDEDSSDSVTLSFDDTPEEMTISPDGSILARGMSTDKGIILTDSKGKEIQTLKDFKYKNISAIWITSDNKYLIVSDTDFESFKNSEITVWDIQLNPGVPVLKIPIEGVVTDFAGIKNDAHGYDVFVTREGVFKGSPLLKIDLSDTGTNGKINDVTGTLPQRISKMALSKDGKLFAIVTLEGTIEVLDTKTIRPIKKIPSVKSKIKGKETFLSITDLDFVSDNTKLLVSYFDTSVRLLEITK